MVLTNIRRKHDDPLAKFREKECFEGFDSKINMEHGYLSIYASDVFRSVGRLLYWFGCPNSGVEVAINNFTMHLIISKWLRRQKCRLKRKN